MTGSGIIPIERPFPCIGLSSKPNLLDSTITYSHQSTRILEQYQHMPTSRQSFSIRYCSQYEFTIDSMIFHQSTILQLHHSLSPHMGFPQSQGYPIHFQMGFQAAEMGHTCMVDDSSATLGKRWGSSARKSRYTVTVIVIIFVYICMIYYIIYIYICIHNSTYIHTIVTVDLNIYVYVYI